MGVIVLLIFGCVAGFFYRFCIFDCVLHGLYIFVVICLCCMVCIVLLIFDCVLHGCYRFGCICSRVAWGFIVLLISGCALQGLYRFVDI